VLLLISKERTTSLSLSLYLNIKLSAARRVGQHQQQVRTSALEKELEMLFVFARIMPQHPTV
jgi:hypothetical protein